MKTIPPALATKIASGVTTLAWCWKVTRSDGLVLGFTDHDHDLTFSGVTYKAASGLTGSAAVERLGLQVDTQDVHGALSSASLTEDDLAKGLWDNAAVEQWRVDWSALADRVLVLEATTGEIERGPLAFRTELRSLAHVLNQQHGRVFGTSCDVVDLGDARCGIDINVPAYRKDTTVTSVVALRSLFRANLGAFAASWCKKGKLIWTSGANNAIAIEVKRHTIDAGLALLELADDLPFDIVAGDGFTVYAGCDRLAKTCFDKFDNIVNFRGFPFMPGNDWVTSYPVQGDGNDGGRL
jgi:uncharacterized phage protein (TIGR02218 family)